MFLLRLSGGLGNQLFQISTAYELNVRSQKNIYIYIGFYKKKLKNNTRRICHFNKDVFENLIKVDYNFFLDFFLKFISRIEKLKITKSKQLVNNLDYRLLNGYFQDFNFFKHNEELLIILRKYFSNNKIQKNTIGLHVRRGDYLLKENKKSFQSIDLKYYKKALGELEKKVDIFTYDILIFSDDIDWCKEKLKFDYNLKYIDNESELSDFRLMSSCEHIITANSTFSWWAAFINDSENRIVITPKYWFTDKNKSFDCPSKWIKI